MPHAEDTRTVPYLPQQMYEMVADVRRYPEFLPWCKALRVRSEVLDVEGRGLLVAGGSDCHGGVKGDPPALGKVRVPLEMLRPLRERLGR